MPEKDTTLTKLRLSDCPDNDPFQSPWHLDDAQYHQLMAESERHQLYGFLVKRQPDALAKMSQQESWKFVTQADNDAKSRSLAALPDRLTYCELALHHGIGFANRPEWQPVWKAVQAEELRLKAAIQKYLPTQAKKASTT